MLRLDMSAWRAQNTSRARFRCQARAITQVAIVGSGPAGFYTAQRLVKEIAGVKVDVFEALPVPYGLVRYGVAPDHPEVKNVIHRFDQLVEANWPQIQFVGNVRLGEHLKLEELRKNYNAVVLAYGASRDRSLGLPLEDELKSVIPARTLISWYNGAFSARGTDFLDLSQHRSCIVVGQGNVALDVARFFLSPIEKLATTDITQRALEQLRKSSVKSVHLVGRRGPLQASFTSKELREILAMDGVQVHVNRQLVEENLKKFDAQLQSDRPRRRLLDILLSASTKAVPHPRKHLHLHFLLSPEKFILDANGNLAALSFTRNNLQLPNFTNYSDAKAVPSGEPSVQLDGSLVVKSIGYLSTPVEGLPWDGKRNVVPNQAGAVWDGAANKVLPGVFVSGWLKTGPTGVIATTMRDAFETARTVALQQSQLNEGSTKLGYKGIKSILESKRAFPVFFKDWKGVEREEELRGKSLGKLREKIVDKDEILEIILRNRAKNTL